MFGGFKNLKNSQNLHTEHELNGLSYLGTFLESEYYIHKCLSAEKRFPNNDRGRKNISLRKYTADQGLKKQMSTDLLFLTKFED